MIESQTDPSCSSDTLDLKKISSPEKIDMKTHDPPVDVLIGEGGTEKAILLNKTCEIQSESPVVKNNCSPEKMETKIHDLPVGVLIGEGGTGKTSLLNKICEIKSEAGLPQALKTENIIKNPNKTGKSSFELIDTPGADRSSCHQEAFRNAVLLREALTFCEVSTIFVFVKYDARHVRMAESLFKVLELVNQYENKIVAVISHWNLSDNPKEEKQSIDKMLGQGLAGVIFYSENDNPVEVADLISSFLEKIPKEKLEIPDKEFFLNFKCDQNSLEAEEEAGDKDQLHDSKKRSRQKSDNPIFDGFACSLI